MVHSAYRKLPPSWRAALKRTLGTDGHGQGGFDWLTARKDSTGKKRLDRALEGLISTIGPDAARGMQDKVCIDFGAGYVPTDGVVLWLLGSQAVYGLDYNKIAKPGEIARAIRTADIEKVRSILESLDLDVSWSDRLQLLNRWANDDRNNFPPGYHYIAPIDVIKSPELIPEFDFLVSTSVLEHVRPSLIVPLIASLTSRQRAAAEQVHRIDLRDHRDFANDPYGFLDPTSGFNAEEEADSRGNGMTLDDWKRLVENNPDWGLCLSSFELGRPHLVPAEAPVRDKRIVADVVVLRSVAEQHVDI